MPQIIVKARAVYLTRYTFFTRDVNQYKNTSISQLYRPPRIPSIANVREHSFLITINVREHSQTTTASE